MSLDTAFYESLREKYGEFLPPVDCTEWCDVKDGHPHDYHVDDQNCWSLSDYTDLTLHPAWEGDGNEDVPQRLGVMARRSAERTVVYLHLDQLKHPYAGTPHDCLDMSLHLTPDEAERLAKALIKKANLVRNQTG